MSTPELSSPISSSGVEVDPQNHGLYLDYDSNNLPEAYNKNETNKFYRGPGQAQAETKLQNRWVISRLGVVLALGWILAIIAIAIAGTLAAKRLHELHHLYAWILNSVDTKNNTFDTDVIDHRLPARVNKASLARQAEI